MAPTALVPAVEAPTPPTVEVALTPPSDAGARTVRPKTVSPAVPATATWSASGADAVWLVSGNKTLPPGKVAPGTYEVRARFQATEVKAMSRLVLEAGQVVTLRCDPDFLVCTR